MMLPGQEEQPSIGSVLHCALLLLGYKTCGYEVHAAPSMFDKSNTKGMEALLHFLLGRLRGPLQTKKDFKGLWPIKDTRQQRDYRKVVHTLLSDMEHGGKLPRRLVAALQSMFTTAAGSRVTELLCHLACNALGQQMQERYSHELHHTCHGQSPAQESLVPLELMEPALMVAAAQNKQQRKRFLSNAATFYSMQDHWQTAADHLVQQFKQLLQRQQQQQQCVEALNAGSAASPLYQPEQLQQAEQLWHDLQGHLLSLVDLRQLVDGVIGNDGHPHSIDGKKLGQAVSSSNAGSPAPDCGVDIMLLLQKLTDTVAAYGPGVASLAGRNECSEVTPLALPASLGGHQSHIAAVLTSSNQHLEQQKQLNAALQVDISSIVAYRQSLVQQVAAGMQRVTVMDSDEQENVRPNGAVRAAHQDARLQLVPPTPVGTAPLQAAAASVAAKKGVPTHGGQSALDTVQGGSALKASVQQAALVREHNWTPGGVRMPLRLAIPPSTIRASTMARADRPHGRAMLTSVVKRGRDLLAPSPISEGGEEEVASRMAGPRRLSYSSPSGGVTYPGQVQEECQKQPSPSVHRTSVMNADTAQADFAEAPLSVAALLARMQKLKSTK